MVKINGEYFALAGSTVSEYLANTDYNLNRIAVEKNGDILPKSEYSQTILNDGDTLEIVSFVGGG